MNADVLYMTDSKTWKHIPEKVVRAQNGDTAAYEELYHENVGRVYALCLRMTHNKTQAEDLTQEAFIRAWQKLKSFKGESLFSTWLHRLTANHVLNTIKRQQMRSKNEIQVDDLSNVERSKGFNSVGTSLDIEHAIYKLPEQARQVFILYQIEGYKHTEIAEMLGLATGTTKAQLHRARKILREVLA